MNKEYENIIAKWFAIIIFSFSAFCAGSCLADERMKREAVENGASRWEVSDDGSPIFVWNTKKE
jgi:hypothetical protein